jgi:rhamnulokinase
MAQMDFLIFDVGSSNGRSIVAHFDGRRFAMEVTQRFDNRPVIAAGTQYWDILRLFSEAKIGLQKSCRQFPQLVSMGLDTIGCDFGFIDRRGRLLNNPVTYRDRMRYERAAELHKIIPRWELFELSAGPTTEIMSIYQLFSFKYEQAVELREAARFLMMPDLLNYFLTGRACNEYTNATLTLLCDQVGKKWEKRILQRLGLPEEIFGEIVMPGTRLGTLQPEVCRELEMAPLPVVAPATHDTASAIAGIPVAGAQQDWAFISLGSWGVVGMETDEPLFSRVAQDAGYGNEGAASGTTFFVRNFNALFILQQCREKWIANRGGEISWEEIVTASLQARPMGGFIDVDAPCFGVPQVDMPEVIRAYCREGGQPVPQDLGEIVRCVYESLALKFRFRLRQLEDFTGRRIEILHMVGGGTACDPLCQWTADACGIAVVAGPTETTTAGNLIMQLKSNGEIASISDGRQLVRSSFALRDYMPQEPSPWEEAYSRFKGLNAEGNTAERKLPQQ